MQYFKSIQVEKKINRSVHNEKMHKSFNTSGRTMKFKEPLSRVVLPNQTAKDIRGK